MTTAMGVAGKLWILLAGGAVISFLGSCENDLKDIQKISASEVNKPVERYTNVDVIYSDSAKVKAHMTAPVMISYKTSNPYTEMPKGVRVIFYDNDLRENGTITADYAIRKEKAKVIELRRNVVGTNSKGETFSSNELIWDENTRQVRSDEVVHVRMADGSVLDGASFTSDESLNHWKFGQASGIIHVNSQQTGP